jgi:hypothetical protein
MANTFQRVQYDLTTGLATAYTCPSATTAIVIGFRLTNIDGSASVNVEAKVGASGTTKYYIAPNTPLPAGSSLGCMEGGEKLVLEASEIIELKASANGDASAQLSILEIS